MKLSSRTGSKMLLGLVLALGLQAAAKADTYNVGLFQGATGTGSGSFSFTNSGASGTASVSLSTNASSTIGVRTFVAGSLGVQVVAVNFNDNKTTAPAGPNQITGNYVEGLTGSLQTAAATGLTGTGQCQNNACFYRINFAFTGNVNPNAATKSYTIQLIRQSNGNVVATPVSGTYSVANIATVPEPGSLLLLGIGLAAMAWLGMRRRRAQGIAV